MHSAVNKRKHRYKGQYRIVMELLLVLIGILLTGYVITIFTTVRTGTTSIALKDGFGNVADELLNSVVKVSTTPNAIERIQIPGKIAENSYKITLDGDNNQIVVTSLLDNRINITRQIFNIGEVNRISKSEVFSSVLVVEIVLDNGGIRIRRGA